MATVFIGGAQEQPKVVAARVLHVDDDPAVARAIASMLRRAGYEVISVATAETARAELVKGAFDVVVSDFNLGGAGTGADVLAAAGSVPFIFLTSDDRADDFPVLRLEKPCTPSSLRKAVAIAAASIGGAK